jgi:8-oxo-dGTP pyrophosphatase MutT (NUDIX family)
MTQFAVQPSMATDKGDATVDKADFAARIPAMIGESRFKKYAVLVPIVETQDGRSLLFEKRSDSLRRQPGEICFPGGRLETDELPMMCAVRETLEELKIEDKQVDILGPGDVFISPFDIIIYPFIGELKDYQYTYNPAEVSEVIAVPISFFLNCPPERYRSTIVNRLSSDFPYDRIPGGANYAWASGSYDVLFYQYHDLLIWGITAYLVQSAAELIDRYHLC